MGSGSGTPGLDQPKDTAEDRLLDTVMLRLRLRDGLDLADVQEQFGESVAASLESCLRMYEEKGLVLFEGQEERRARLVDPEGLLVSNDILAELFALVPDDEE